MPVSADFCTGGSSLHASSVQTHTALARRILWNVFAGREHCECLRIARKHKTMAQTAARDTRAASMRYPRDGRQAAQQEDETAHSCRHALSGPPCQAITAYIDCITSSASIADFERANPGHNLARQDGMTQPAIAGHSGMIPGKAPPTWLLAGLAAGQWRHYHARERGGGLTANDDLRVNRQKYFDASR